MFKSKPCTKKGHKNCFDWCDVCKHCDTSYEKNPKLVCNCTHCVCNVRL